MATGLAPLIPAAVLCLDMFWLAGCGSVQVTFLRQPPANLSRPQRVLVYDFAVTPQDIQVDHSYSAQLYREISGNTQTDEEVRVGRVVAAALTDSLVSELRSRGISASRGSEGQLPYGALAIRGQFLRVDQGDQTVRTLVGFGLGATMVRTRVQFYQNVGGREDFIAEALTEAKSSLRPGMGVTLPVSAAVGSVGTAAAFGGGTAVASEVFFSTVQADARRTAKAIAERVAAYHEYLGWLR